MGFTSEKDQGFYTTLALARQFAEQESGGKSALHPLI